ncbi:PH domain-containing protein [Halorarum salinum]|uniref:PH domain-containing protein n=1 Tax=Halorarum salinum TaxID=2743089 RepID=A0A7D5LC78_9EURY|nr:PH domain-containing protein [Halobaculum salinum]QLG62509.1 PH domain-containing protein [Halobaculum salinum]
MTRLHPLSAVLDAARAALQFGSFGFFAVLLLSGPLGFGDAAAAFVLAPLGAVVGAGYAVARYLRFEYDLRPEHLVVTSGVFARQEREIPLRRIQNVDVSRGVIQRLLGLATVRFETAGGSATEATLDAVGVDEAERLRHEVGERVRAVRERERASGDAAGRGATAESTGQAAGTAGTRTGPADGLTGTERGPRTPAAEPERETLYEISGGDLLVLSAVSFRPGAIAAPVFGAPFVGDLVVDGLLVTFRLLGGGRGGGFPDDLAILFTALAGLLAFALAVWVASAALTYVRYYDFRLERVADELRYERGLAGRYSGTIPLDKMQTVTVGENAAMRRLGYASLSVETAGYAPGSDGAGGAETTVPLASRDRVFSLARDLQPFGERSFRRPPTRARRRYAVRYVIVSFVLAGLGLAAARALSPVPDLVALVPLVGLPLAPVAARAKWRHRGYDEADDAVLTRSGFWHRSTRVVPYYRLQTVFVRRTVFQRRWGLASVTADTASTSSFVVGDATAYDLDGGDADRLRERLIERLRADLAERRGSGGTRGDGRRGDDADEGAGEDDADGYDAGEDDRLTDEVEADEDGADGGAPGDATGPGGPNA